MAILSRALTRNGLTTTIGNTLSVMKKLSPIFSHSSNATTYGFHWILKNFWKYQSQNCIAFSATMDTSGPAFKMYVNSLRPSDDIGVTDRPHLDEIAPSEYAIYCIDNYLILHRAFWNEEEGDRLTGLAIMLHIAWIFPENPWKKVKCFWAAWYIPRYWINIIFANVQDRCVNWSSAAVILRNNYPIGPLEIWPPFHRYYYQTHHIA